MKVISKQIPGYSRYLIYSDGQVWDLQEQKFMEPKLNGRYLKVSLIPDIGKSERFYLHRLVAQTFIPNPENKPCVDHKDTDKINNTVYINDDGSVNEELSNLHWVTHKENSNNPLTRQHISEGYTDERKQDYSEWFSGENNPNYNKDFSGENNPFYGKHHTEDALKKMRKPRSEEAKANMKGPKKYRNKITGHVTTSSIVTKWINQGKTTEDQWEPIENN